MSKYVMKMKDVLKSFNSETLRIREKMSGYLPEKELAKLQQDLNQAAESARSQIDAIHNEAGSAARKWATADGRNIDEADLNLLKGSFELSSEDLHDLMIKHQGSYVMVSAIAKYANERNVVLEYVPNLADKLMAYTAFCSSAHQMISFIAGNLGMPMDSIVFASWGLPGNISQRMELILYGLKKRGINQPQPQAKFEFNFKPLSGR